MKNELTVNNLVASYYDNGLHELEFDINGTTVFVRNIKANVNGNEHYWDDTINVKRVVNDANDDDIIKEGND